MVLKLLFLAFTFSLPALAGDHLILIGTSLGNTRMNSIASDAYDKDTHTLDGTKTGEWALVQTICNSYKSARSKGVEVTMLIGANLKCKDGTVIESYPGCGIHSCSESVIKKALKVSSKKIKKGDNLILQTASHGEDGTGDLYLNDASGKMLTKKEIAQALNESGIPAKVKKINGVYYQCFSGHHNDLGEYLKPKVRYCSISQAKPYITATVSKSANEKSNDSFTKNIWDSYKENEGIDFIKAAANAEATQGWNNINRSHIHKWGISSEHLAKKYLLKNKLNTHSVEDSQSIFGINDDYWENGFGQGKASWRFRNDFKSLRAETGEYMNSVLQRSTNKNIEQLKKIEILGKKWQKEYENRDYLTQGLELISMGDEKSFRVSKKDKFVNLPFKSVRSHTIECTRTIADDVKIHSLINNVSDSVAVKIFTEKQRHMNEMVSSKEFQEGLDKCLSKKYDEALKNDAVYRTFTENEKTIYNKLNDLIANMKKEIREEGNSYSDTLNKKKVKIQALKLSEPITSSSYGKQYEHFAIKPVSGPLKSVSYKDAIKYYKSFLSQNYVNTEKNIEGRRNDLSYELMNCKAFAKFVPVLAEMNTLKKMNDIYEKIEDPKTKNKFINKVMCEMGE